ncbi:TPA: RepB family plasmid replication initiator protein [Acinetobacter baumannii]|nr:RepB family plasmid replication initiator protein [Acinetobacter baumannii]
MRKELVVKDNALINASYNLSLVEQRLVLLAVIEARNSGKGISSNDPLCIHAESYITQFNVHRNGAYKALKEACKDLFVRQFSYEEERKRGLAKVTSRWVSEIAYIDNAGCVELIFAPAIIPLITRLEKHFTSYELEQVSNLTSAYSVRLYEILIAWRSTGKTPIIDLAELRTKIGVLDDEYSKVADLKKRVIEPSIKQINEHTDIRVTYEQHKSGRNITGLSFKFKQIVKQQNEKPKRDPDTIDLFSKMTDAQRHLLASKLSRLHEMSEYSVGNESFEDLAKRIYDKLQDEKFFKSVMPLFDQIDYKPY